MKETTTVIEVPEIVPTVATIHIVGDTDLVLNKMDDCTVRQLTDERKDKAKKMDKPNQWEQIVTSIHWLHGKPDLKPEEYTEETLKEKLENDSPCISAFGFKKQLNKAVVRYKIDTYSTGFDANVLINAKGDNLIPITWTSHFIDESLMSPKRGAPVLTRTNRFSGWAADVEIAFMDKMISLPSIINVFNLMGFGIGIGSGTSSGYGRFHVENGTVGG